MNWRGNSCFVATVILSFNGYNLSLFTDLTTLVPYYSLRNGRIVMSHD